MRPITYTCRWGGGDSVIDIDGSDNSTTTINVNENPLPIVVNPLSSKVYSEVYVIDGSTNEVVTSIAVGEYTNSIAVDTALNRVYTGNYRDRTVSVIDGSSNAVIATVGVGSSPMGVWANSSANRVYTSNLNDGTVSVLQDE